MGKTACKRFIAPSSEFATERFGCRSLIGRNWRRGRSGRSPLAMCRNRRVICTYVAQRRSMNERTECAEVQDIANKEDQHPAANAPLLSARFSACAPHTSLPSRLAKQMLYRALRCENEQKIAIQSIIFLKMGNFSAHFLIFAKTFSTFLLLKVVERSRPTAHRNTMQRCFDITTRIGMP